MKSIKYDKEEFQDLVNSVTPLQAVEWLLMNGYPIQVRNLGKSTVDILCPSPDHNDTILEIAKYQRIVTMEEQAADVIATAAIVI